VTPDISEPSANWPEPRADWRQPSARQRALVIGLTLLAELLFLLILLGLGPATWTGRDAGQPTLVDLIDAPKAAAPEPAPASAKSDEAATRAATVSKPSTPKLPPSPRAKEAPFVELTREEFAAADISKLGSAGGKGKSGGETTASVGTGPGGVTLYKAEWYREPTNAELSGYITQKSVEPGSWAEIACKTIPDNRVENCQSLGESPLGSGLGKAIRLAGWQFRIRPPRIDGKPQVGTWVKIHIEFTR
jgi:protein TonB